MIEYVLPDRWTKYDSERVSSDLVKAKAAVLSLQNMPYQREWVQERQEMEFKREVAGTSRIEGAEFTERELEDAIKDTADDLETRSQRQVRAAVKAYRWIATIPDDQPLSEDVLLNIHRQMVTGADDDHCEPGVLRGKDENVHFGNPRHRGVEGGPKCTEAFTELVSKLNSDFLDHDFLIQGLVAHYHLAAMHPFLDGNGRTARALEALILQRGGLKDSCFISMSNYYYDEKLGYLKHLAEVRRSNHDLTNFIQFGLKGIYLQCTRLLNDIKIEIAKVLFENTMYMMFNRLKSARKRVMAERQISALKILLEEERMSIRAFIDRIEPLYRSLKNSHKAQFRDLAGLVSLGAVKVVSLQDPEGYDVAINLDWPTEITETEFMRRVKEFPKSKTSTFLP